VLRAAEELRSVNAVDGTVYLKADDIEKDKIFLLDAEWDFYWSQLLTPEQLGGRDPHVTPRLTARLSPSRSWSKVDSSLGVQKKGYATYHLKVRLDRPTRIMSLRTNRMRNATQLWVNGEPAVSRGRVGTSFAEVISDETPLRVSFKPEGTEIDLVLQTANFHNHLGGGGYLLRLGAQSAIDKAVHAAMIKDGQVFGSLFIIALFHLGLWLLLRENKVALFFGIFCALMAVRSIVTREAEMLRFFFPDMTWVQLTRLEYLTVSAVPPFLYHFIHLLFPKELGWRPTAISWTIGLVFSAYFLIASPVDFGDDLIYTQISVMLVGLWFLVGVIRAAFHGRDGAYPNLAGAVVIALALVNDVLVANQVIPSVYLLHYATVFLVFIQAIALSAKFHKIYLLEVVARKKYEALNENLEKQVEDRTITIRTILDNVKSGFFLVDIESKVKDGFTRSCNSILHLNLELGRKFPEIFCFSVRDQESIEMAVEQVFDDLLPETVTLANIPSRFTLNSRVYTLDGAVVRGEDHSVRAILFTTSDITELYKIEDENNRNRMLLNILNYKEAFRAFLADAIDWLADAKEQFESMDQALVRAYLHTLKGNTALFEMTELAGFIHQIEESPRIEKSHLDNILVMLDQFLATYQNILGLDFHSIHEEVLQLKHSQVTELETAFTRVRTYEEVIDIFKSWEKVISSVPVATVLGPIERSVAGMAARLGKQVNFTLQCGNIMINPGQYWEVFQNIIHLIRNSIDHGIEMPQQREFKKLQGQISLFIDESDENYELVIQDDGRGINMNGLVEKATSLGILTPAQASLLSSQQILELIYDDRLSLATSSSGGLSGRGVGMSAIRHSILKIGGTLTVDTVAGKGTKFTIILPKDVACQTLDAA
jgi:signal transduction histidine kinase